MVWINRYHGYALAHRELKFRLLSASQHRQPTEDSLLQAMPSASPLYNQFPNGLVDPDCPYRYPGSGDHVPFSGCPVPTDAVSGGGSKLPAEYDPFKYLSAMTEQSLSDSFPSQSTHACAAAASGSQFLFNQSAQMHGGYQCTATSPPAATSSSQQFFASQSPGCCMYSSENSPHAQRMGGFTPGGTDAEGFGMSQTVRGAGGGGDPPACKKNFLCSTEELMESGDSDSLLSWTRQHPEHWSRAEVLDWLFFVAQERGLDMQDFRGEAFQSLTGSQLCHMTMDDFMLLEPKYGILLYQMLKKLLSGVLFSKPAENQNLQAAGDCTDLSPYSAVSCDSSRDSPDAATFQGYLIPRKPCPNFSAHENYWKQERTEWKPQRTDPLQTDVIDIDSYIDFDPTEAPNIPATAGQQPCSIEPCPSEYEPVFTPSYPTTPMRTFCYYPGSSYPPQLPRRRPGRPRVKSLPEDEERSSRDKKVKNQHLWEFIYETLLNPLYNPQYLRWENQREGVFRFVQSEAVAQLWGSRKNNENMTYEKLSRAMRHYYKRGILERVEGRRLVYKFSRKAMDRVREKRHNSV